MTRPVDGESVLKGALAAAGYASLPTTADENGATGLLFPELVAWALSRSGYGRVQLDMSKKYGVVAGVLRNPLTGGTAGTWAAISSAPHTPINIDSVTQGSGNIEINYTALGATNVVTFLAVPDETFVLDGYGFGPSVSTTQAVIVITRHKEVGAFISSNGTSFSYTNDKGITSVSYNAGTGKLTINHNDFSMNASSGKSVPLFSGRNGGSVPQLNTFGDAFTEVTFYDWAGVAITTQATTQQCTFTRTEQNQLWTAANVRSDGGNVWIIGVFEIA